MKEIQEDINKFKEFESKEVNAAIKELEGITTESNRKHLQRLVYVNLVNRFDALVDNLLLKFSILDGLFKVKVLQETKGEEVFLKDIYEILLSENPKNAVQQRVENVARGKFLSQRHSLKLRTLLFFCFSWPETDLDRPRVFTNNGSIFVDNKRLKPYQIPDTVIGYADWLYARRNALVHGDGKKLASKDLGFMQQKFGAKPASTISLKISSIKSAVRFYNDLCEALSVPQDLVRGALE
ncbi:MAG: hypothetical protein AB200_00415 [Parcubacteria bacterium C7867-005]|nr:MAG: hypothetical protein AB200_00415 [Parcubacteria bacterium C7867-005]